MKVLIVDDNSDDRLILKYNFQEHGCEVLEAQDGEEGMMIAEAQKPDLIISDALMPKMDGFQFLRALKKDDGLRSIPFIFYSAVYTGYKEAELAISIGANAFIIKPKEPKELWDEISNVIEEIRNKKENVLKAEVIKEEEEFLSKYSHIVATKLEEKIRELEKEIEERKKLEKQLLQAQKMEAIGQLAGGIAHDFNNILTAIITYGHSIKMKIYEDKHLMSYADYIISLSEKAASLTQSLLAFSRKQILNPLPVNLNEIVKNVEKFLFRIIGEDIELKTKLHDQDLIIMADHVQIEQVLINLATNARDAMPSGGLLSIGTGFVHIDRKTFGFDFEKEGDFALITVTDTGKGMDEKIKAKIFEPFFTTKEIGKGTGLGLAMVYGIVKQHNGYIDVYSEPGKGTTFKIYFPLAKPAASETEERLIQEPIGGNETLLIAEDNPEVRASTKTILLDFGYRVFEAKDGDDTLSKYELHKSEIDLVILDMIMPKMNGWEVYEKIREISPEAKVIFTSGYAEELIHSKGYIKEGLAFIIKPIKPLELLNKIREVLDRK